MLYILILAHVFSCASGYKRPESFNQKMHRYQARISANSIPRLTVSARQFKTRTPASIPKSSAAKATSLNPSENDKSLANIHFSNKRLYFLSLMDQYRSFQSFLSQKEGPSINSCPGLHGAFLEYKRVRPQSPSKRAINFNPEGVLLALPLGHNPQSKTLKDVEKSKRSGERFQKALSVHTEKIYSELVELCQYGTSDNYYAYENLMTHLVRQPEKFTISAQSLQILIKTTIFANKIILSAIEKQSPPDPIRSPSSIPEEREPWFKKAMKKNHLGWSEQYFHTVKD